jgi:HPt (histidine-containing phosphotransfer) domain-containing protein
MSSGHPALDPAAIRVLSDMVGGDRETLVEIVDAFLEEGPQRVAELRRGVTEGEAVLAGRAAHTLKANGQTFGASALEELCRELETRARTDDLAGVASLVDRVDEEWARVLVELVELRHTAGA